MPIIVCFEGHLTAEPKARPAATNLESTEHSGPRSGPEPLEVTATVSVPPTGPPHPQDTSRGPVTSSAEAGPTRYHIRARGVRAEALARLGAGDSVVVIGHVETEVVRQPDEHPIPGPRRRYQDTVVVDAIGTSLTHPGGAGEPPSSSSNVPR